MPDPPRRFQFTADRGDVALRLDRVLLRHVTHLSRLSRAQVQQWIAAGLVEVDGTAAHRAASRVRDGATVSIRIPASAPERARPAAEDAPLRVLYEDESIVALDKPAGVVVHPSYKQTGGTLLNALLGRLRHRPDAAPGIVTRLDKDTSGVVLVALSPAVHAALQRDAAAGLVRKEYLAIVRGTPRPARGRILLPLARNPADRRRVIATPHGAPSETRYEVLSRTRLAAATGSPLPAGARTRSLVCCTLVTGRTHQIRVHLSARGWPIVGDRVYGEPDDAIARQALHAWRLTLPHPLTRAALELVAPIPEDMARLEESDDVGSRG